MPRSKLILIDLLLAILIDCLRHHLTAIGLQNLISGHLILLPILNGLLLADGSPHWSSRSLLVDGLALEGFGEFGVLSELFDFFGFLLVVVVMVLFLGT